MGFMFEYPLLFFFFQKSFLPKWEGWLRCLARGQDVLSKWCKNDEKWGIKHQIVNELSIWTTTCCQEEKKLTKERYIVKRTFHKNTCIHVRILKKINLYLTTFFLHYWNNVSVSLCLVKSCSFDGNYCIAEWRCMMYFNEKV